MTSLLKRITTFEKENLTKAKYWQTHVRIETVDSYGRKIVKVIKIPKQKYECIRQSAHSFEWQPEGDHYQGVCRHCSYAPEGMMLSVKSNHGISRSKGAITSRIVYGTTEIDFPNKALS